MENENKATNEYSQLQQRVTDSSSRPKHILTMEDRSGAIGWCERVVKLVDTYGMKKIFLALLTVASFLALLMFANAIDNQQVIEKWLAKQETEHSIGSEIRKDVNPKVTSALVRMLYRLNADRVSVMEMHNGKENPASLPFIYCDMTYEETKENVPYISEEYVDLNMSKYSFPSYLYKHRYFIGTVKEIYKIDKKLALRLEANGVAYCGMMLIRTNIDIGFLIVSYYNAENKVPNEILAELTYSVQEIGKYLDYTNQMNKK